MNRSYKILFGTPPIPSPNCLANSSSSLTRVLSYLMLNLSCLTCSMAGSFSGGGSMKFMIFSSTQKSMNLILSSSWIFFSSSIALLRTTHYYESISLKNPSYHFINGVILSLICHMDPVFKLGVHLNGFRSNIPQPLESPVADLGKSKPENALLNFDCSSHFSHILGFFSWLLIFSRLLWIFSTFCWCTAFSTLVLSSSIGQSHVRYELGF